MAAEKIGDGTEREALKEKTEPRRAPAGSRHVGDPSLTAPPPPYTPQAEGEGTSRGSSCGSSWFKFKKLHPGERGREGRGDHGEVDQTQRGSESPRKRSICSWPLTPDRLARSGYSRPRPSPASGPTACEPRLCHRHPRPPLHSHLLASGATSPRTLRHSPGLRFRLLATRPCIDKTT